MSSEDDGAVKIAVRERPIIENYAGNRTSVVAYHSTNKNIIIVNERPYEFDNAFGPNVTQKQLYEELVKPLVQRTLQGYFCTVLADGQTGTGKTFTIGLHDTCQAKDSLGVIPRALRDIFTLSDGSEGSLQIFVSFVEIYNEKVYDLLSDDTNEQVNIKGFRFAGGMKKHITNAEEGFAVLAQGNKLRHTRPTKMNPESSRSHAIFTIHVSRETEISHFTSLLHLVDLAGSEGVRRTGHQGVALTEGVHINQGLLAIGKVLQALALKWKVIPYRDSVLTSVLQDSLKSNSYLALLACISPFPEDLSETVATLRFATNARSLKHSPQINAILQEIKIRLLCLARQMYWAGHLLNRFKKRLPRMLDSFQDESELGELRSLKTSSNYIATLLSLSDCLLENDVKKCFFRCKMFFLMRILNEELRDKKKCLKRKMYKITN